VARNESLPFLHVSRGRLRGAGYDREKGLTT
jgi:hypothetical protein